MKIKTITCHDVYNFGASLQAYALMKYLQNLGHDVEIIDYKPDYLSNHFRLDLIANPKYEKNIILKIVYLTLKFPNRFIALHGKQKKAFDQFKNDYLKLTTEKYASNECLKNNVPDADIYIAGSDQIWNCIFQNGRDSAFYLDFAPKNKIKCSYAASFATEKLDEKYTDFIRDKLKNLNYISVREKSGINILKSLGIENGFQTLDPVFLLNCEEWNHIVVDKQYHDKYLLVYDFDKSDRIKEIALEIASKKGYKIYSFYKTNYADKVFVGIGPLEFISLIKNSSFVISNSFHATAFSIIYSKEFYVVNREEKINTRMRDLLDSLGITCNLISNVNDINLETHIQYHDVNEKLNYLIRQSKEYLRGVIKGAK